MEEVEALNYEVEVQRLHDNLNNNFNTVKRFLTQYETDAITAANRFRTKLTSISEEKTKIKQRIEELRQAIQQSQLDNKQEREGVEQLKREMEKCTVALQGKKEEVERQKELLKEYAEKIKKEATVGSDAKLRNQRKVSQAETSIQLFKTHLGLNITCMRNDRFLLKFTQVSHSQPDTEYMVDLSLDGDSYCLLGSEPPLPSLPQLQEELNASGNLIACILKIRKEYQRMSSKRPRE